MKEKINKDEIVPQQDACGLIRELYSSKHMTLAHVEVIGTARKHLHKMLEEIYYVTKGEGELLIEDRVIKIKEGDMIPIPKNTYHELRTIEGEPFEILFITYPQFTLDDVYFD